MPAWKIITCILAAEGHCYISISRSGTIMKWTPIATRCSFC